MVALKTCLTLFVVLYLLPLGISAARYWLDGTGAGWRTADRSSVGVLPPADSKAAVVRIFAAQTVRWRGIFATHSWIVFKPANTSSYTRYDYTAWGDPVRLNGFEPDGRWFGRPPAVVFAADGDLAEAMIPLMQAAIANFAWQKSGDYSAWPGPNSNTFVQAIMDNVPQIRRSLPPTAIGKDYPYDGRWVHWTASGSGVRITLGGYVGVTVAWVEGVEINILGGVLGLDLRHPAIKLPGLGRFGMHGSDDPITSGT
jgi:Protein of unknown function (DUF3750)